MKSQQMYKSQSFDCILKRQSGTDSTHMATRPKVFQMRFHKWFEMPILLQFGDRLSSEGPGVGRGDKKRVGIYIGKRRKNRRQSPNILDEAQTELDWTKSQHTEQRPN